MNNYNFSFIDSKKENPNKKKSLKYFADSDFFLKKNYQNKTRISVNLSGKNQIEKPFSERRKIIKNNKNLGLMYIGKLNSDNYKNDYLYKKLDTNNIFLQTETTMRKLTERKKDLRKNILTDSDLKQITKEKGSLIRENFYNNYFMEKGRGTFSPFCVYNKGSIFCSIKFNIVTFLFDDNFFFLVVLICSSFLKL